MAHQTDTNKKTYAHTSLIADIFSTQKDIHVGPPGFHDVYKRFERICAAVLYIGSVSRKGHDGGRAMCDTLFSEVEEVALNVLKDAASLCGGFRDDTGLSVRDLRQRCVHLVSLVRMLAAARCVSVPNTDMLVRAIEDALTVVINLQHSSLAEDVVLTRDDLLPAFSGGAESSNVRDVVKKVVKQASPRSDTAHTAAVSVNSAPRSALGSVGGREEVTLSVLRKFGALGIKDIAIHMPDCGEKTVQRLLANLVKKGLVLKEGEKRWSKYRVV